MPRKPSQLDTCVAAFQKIMRERYAVKCGDPKCYDCRSVVRAVLTAANLSPVPVPGKTED